MNVVSNSPSRFIILFILIVGLIPAGWYWVMVGRVPTITAVEALSLLNQPDSEVALVDVRETVEFDANHIKNAINWPLSAIQNGEDRPHSIQDKTLLLVSAAGIKSMQATKLLKRQELVTTVNVRGGLQEWIRALNSLENQAFANFSSLTGASIWQNMPLPQQIAAIAAGYVVKPVYMILSLLIVLFLWRLKAGDLVALRWGMIFFFVGEAFCAINYIFFGEKAYWAEYLHSYGMVVAFAFVTYALIDGLDSRIIKFSQLGKRCTFLELCGDCVKYNEVRCGATRLFLWLIPLMAVLALIPLVAAPVSASYNTTIVGTPYNYLHLVIYQIFEIRFLPVVSLILVSLAWMILWQQRNELLPHATKLLFAAGSGALGFSFFRLLLIGIYQNDLMWATFWEEVTELMFVTAVGVTLWLFRQTLFRERFLKSHPVSWRDMMSISAQR